MIDIHARSKLAEASRWLVSGLISNYEYDDLVLYGGAVLNSGDPAIRSIYNSGFWLLYDDLRQYSFTGRNRLSQPARKAAARYVLFLKSGLPYGWPVLSRPASFGLTVLNLVTLGAAGLVYSRWAKRGRNIAYWPFTDLAQYTEALQSPVYLSGHGL